MYLRLRWLDSEPGWLVVFGAWMRESYGFSRRRLVATIKTLWNWLVYDPTNALWWGP